MAIADKHEAFDTLTKCGDHTFIDTDLKPTSRILYYFKKLFYPKQLHFVNVAKTIEHYVDSNLTFIFSQSYQNIAKAMSNLIGLKIRAEKIKNPQLKDQACTALENAVSRVSSVLREKGVSWSNPLTLYERFLSWIGFFSFFFVFAVAPNFT